MLDHSASAREDQPPAGIAAARAVMAREEPVDLPDEMLRQEGKRLLWRLWGLLSEADRAAFLTWANGGGNARDR